MLVGWNVKWCPVSRITMDFKKVKAAREPSKPQN